MEENSAAAKKGAYNHSSEESEGDEDDNAAAMILVKMKKTRFDDEILKELERMKKEFIKRQEEIASLPPVEKLMCIFGRCTEKPYEKTLKRSDVSDDQNRLSLKKEFVDRFIRPLLKQSENSNMNKGIAVTTYDEEGTAYPMTFKTWASEKYNVLIGMGWKKFRLDHTLVPSGILNVWMFRHRQTDNPCFVIVPKSFPTPSSSSTPPFSSSTPPFSSSTPSSSSRPSSSSTPFSSPTPSSSSRPSSSSTPSSSRRSSSRRNN